MHLRKEANMDTDKYFTRIKFELQPQKIIKHKPRILKIDNKIVHPLLLLYWIRSDLGFSKISNKKLQVNHRN